MLWAEAQVQFCVNLHGSRVTRTKFTAAGNAADSSRGGIISQSVVQHLKEQSAKLLTVCLHCRSAPTSAAAMQLLSCSASRGWRHWAPQPLLLGRANHLRWVSSTSAGKTQLSLGAFTADPVQ